MRREGPSSAGPIPHGFGRPARPAGLRAPRAGKGGSRGTGSRARRRLCAGVVNLPAPEWRSGSGAYSGCGDWQRSRKRRDRFGILFPLKK